MTNGIIIKPKEWTLPEALALWGKAKGKDRFSTFSKLCEEKANQVLRKFDIDPEDEYAEYPEYSPYVFVDLLITETKWETLKDLAKEALDSKYHEEEDYDEHDHNRYWLPVLAKAYLNLGKEKEAKEAIARSLLYVVPYRYSMALENLVSWYKGHDDKEKEDIIYYESAKALGIVLNLQSQKHSGWHARPKNIGRKFDEVLDEWLTMAWDLKSLSGKNIQNLLRFFRVLCENKEEYLPKLTKKWEEVIKERKRRKTESLTKFKTLPSKLKREDLPWILDFIYYNPDVLKDDKKFKGILEFLPDLNQQQLVNLMYAVLDERPFSDFIKIAKIGEMEKHVKSGKTIVGGNLVEMLIYLAPHLGMSGKFKEALQLFDFLIDIPNLNLTVYNNALWAVMHDNNKLPLDPKRERKYLKSCLPYGPKDPAIFYNAACIYYELGELDKVFENIKLAIHYNFEDIEAMRTEPLFKPIFNDPRFKDAFETSPAKKRGSKIIK